MKQENDENRVSVRELYTLIDSVKKELLGSVNRLENKFDTMESGRLTLLEGRVGQLAARQANGEGQMKTTAFLIPLSINIFFAIANIVLFFYHK